MQVSALLQRVGEWGFDIFELEELLPGQVLSCTAFALFKRLDAVKRLKLNDKKLVRWGIPLLATPPHPTAPHHTTPHRSALHRTPPHPTPPHRIPPCPTPPYPTPLLPAATQVPDSC